MTVTVDSIIDRVDGLLAYAENIGRPLTVEEQQALAYAIEEARETINRLTTDFGEPAPAPQPAPQIPEQARLLWILSGGDPTTFAQYARQFPSDEVNQIASNPAALNNLIANLQNQMPQGRPGQADGIPEAGLQSSNIYGFQYDPRTGKLKVRFQEGNVYEYDNVPPAIYQIFSNGAVPAKTNGRNRWGFWFKGKNPSLGAAFHALIKLGGYPYQKLS